LLGKKPNTSKYDHNRFVFGNKSGTHINIFIGTSWNIGQISKKRDVKLAPEELLKRGERFKQYFVPSRLGRWIGLEEDGENPGS
jgi:hypothetical protein